MNDKRLCLMSRFYTSDNYLILQIRLINGEGQVIMSQEFKDYSEFKTAFATLQRQVRSGETGRPTMAVATV